MSVIVMPASLVLDLRPRYLVAEEQIDDLVPGTVALGGQKIKLSKQVFLNTDGNDFVSILSPQGRTYLIVILSLILSPR